MADIALLRDAWPESLHQQSRTDFEISRNAPQAFACLPAPSYLDQVKDGGLRTGYPACFSCPRESRLGSVRDINPFLLRQRSHDGDNDVAHDP
jgi:hypothetical protein